MSNKSTGNTVEREFCELMASHGFWVHNLAQNSAGQPADVIMARNGESYLIDVKDCSTTRGFALSRLEPNQISAMSKWSECGNTDGLFALKVEGEFYLIPLWKLIQYKLRHGSMAPDVIRTQGQTIEEWLHGGEEEETDGQ